MAKTWTAETLKNFTVQDRLSHCPGFIRQLVAMAKDRLHANKIWIFGSRSRGDARGNSDFDFVIDFPKSHEDNWAGFSIEAQEDLPTLHYLDILDYGKLDHDFKLSIESEGILLYEKK